MVNRPYDAEVEGSITKFDLEVGWDSICDPAESEQHRSKKFEVARNLIDDGWKVELEKELYYPAYHTVDIAAEKDGKTLAVEVGQLGVNKRERCEELFDNFKNVPFTKDGRTVSEQGRLVEQ